MCNMKAMQEKNKLKITLSATGKGKTVDVQNLSVVQNATKVCKYFDFICIIIVDTSKCIRSILSI